MNPPGEPIRNTAAPLLVLAIFLAIVPAVSAQSTDTIFLRGRKQTLHLYGDRGKPPVIITSGDGGWLHLVINMVSLAAFGAPVERMLGIPAGLASPSVVTIYRKVPRLRGAVPPAGGRGARR